MTIEDFDKQMARMPGEWKRSVNFYGRVTYSMGEVHISTRANEFVVASVGIGHGSAKTVVTALKRAKKDAEKMVAFYQGAIDIAEECLCPKT